MITTQKQQPEVGREYNVVGHPRASYLGERNEKHFFKYEDAERGTMIVTTPAQYTTLENDTIRIKPGSTFRTGLVSLKGIKEQPEAAGLLKILGELGVRVAA